MQKAWLAFAAVGLGALLVFALGFSPRVPLESRSVPELIRDLESITGRTSGHNLQRVQIAEALAKRGAETVEPLVALMKSAPGHQARLGALEALGRIGDRRGFEVIAAGVHDADSSVRVFSIMALERIPGTDVDEVLLAALATNDRSDTIWAAAALGARREARAVPRLKELYERAGDPIGKTKYAEPLAKIGGPDALGFLADQLVIETSAFVRSDLSRLLGSTDDPHVADILRASAGHPEVVAGAHDFFLRTPESVSEDTLIAAFNRYGGPEMEQAFLKSGRPALVNAAQQAQANPRPKAIDVK